MKMKIGVLGLLLVLLLSLVASSCTGSASVEKPPIKIGSASSLTGPIAGSGISHDNAVRMALEEINYEVAGRKIQFIFEDTEFKADVALTKAKKLVEGDGVKMLMGIVNSASAYALRDYVIAQKIPLLISNQAGADEITKSLRSPYILRCSINNYKNTAPMADYAYKQLGYRTMVVAANDFVAGYEYTAAFQRVFTRLGGKIVQEWYAPMNTPDFSPYIAKIDTSADAIFNFFPGVDGLRFIKQYSEYGLKDKLPMLVHASTEEEVLQGEGDTALGILGSRTWFPSIPTDINKKFVDEYYAKYHESPTGSAAAGYVGTKIVIEALKAVNGNIEDTDAFLAALRSATVEGPFGKVSFDDYGMMTSNMYIGRVEKVEGRPWDYEHQIIYTYENVDQFWPFTPEEYSAMPVLSDMKGKLVSK